MDDLMGTTEIANLLGVSRQRADQLAAQEGFPAPVATLAAGRIWQRDDIVRWNTERLAAATAASSTAVLACSFCAKDNKSVAKLVAGPNGIFICNECVNLCVEIMDEEGIS